MDILAQKIRPNWTEQTVDLLLLFEELSPLPPSRRGAVLETIWNFGSKTVIRVPPS